MRLVFLEDVPGVAQGGEVKEVRNGFARNYLIPQKLAVMASRNSLQRAEKLKQRAEVKRLKTLRDMKALGEEMDGVQVDVEMRAGASGRLYGSVTNSIVAEKLSSMTGREIDRRTVEIPEPIRELGVFEVPVRLHPEVDANLKLLVYPAGSDPGEYLASLSEDKAEAEGELATGEAEVPEDTSEAEVAAVGQEPPEVPEESAGGQ